MKHLDPFDAPGLAWLRPEARPDAVAVACRLPGCAVAVTRNESAGRPAWFCSPTHAQTYRRRRQAIDYAVTLAAGQLDARGSVLAKRSLASKLAWLRTLRHDYTEL